MTQFSPIGNRLLVRLDESEETFAGGLVIPDTVKEKPTTGIVEAHGQGSSHSIRLGEVTSVARLSIEDQGVRVGDRVLLASAYVGAETGEDGLILVDMSEVLAVLE